MNLPERKLGMTAIRNLHNGIPISAKDRAGIESAESQGAEPIQLQSSRKYPLLLDPDHKEASEYYSILRTRLLNARAKSGLCSVLVTSAQKQEGKSLICVNLAISLAQLKRDRILLIDGDLRMKGITGLLDMHQKTGLGDFLQDRVSFDACVRETNVSHLCVTGAGQIAEELVPAALEGPRWLEFLDLAKRDFGLIVVDSVPVTAPIADFELLLGACDAALLIVRLRRARWNSLEIASARMNGKLLGVVVNNSDPSADFDDYSYSRGKQKSST